MGIATPAVMNPAPNPLVVFLDDTWALGAVVSGNLEDPSLTALARRGSRILFPSQNTAWREHVSSSGSPAVAPSRDCAKLDNHSSA